MRITIHVTQKDIDAARNDPYENHSYVESCPVARAVNKALIGTFWVDGICVRLDDSIWYAKLSDKTKDFIMAYDGKKTIEPISFRINVPKELVK